MFEAAQGFDQFMPNQFSLLIYNGVQVPTMSDMEKLRTCLVLWFGKNSLVGIEISSPTVLVFCSIYNLAGVASMSCGAILNDSCPSFAIVLHFY
jgi:hypothetical protein